MIRVGRIQLYVILLIFSGFCVFGQSFIHLWVGEAFNTSYYVFLLLVFVNFLSLTLRIAGDMVLAENKIKHTAIRGLVSSLIGLVLSIIVAPKYGAVGCAAATGLALVLSQILSVDFYQRKMGLDMGYFFKNCHLKIMPLIVIYAVAGYFICCHLIVNNWLILFVVIAVYTIGYFAIAWFLLINDYEKGLILGFVTKKNNKNE